MEFNFNPILILLLGLLMFFPGSGWAASAGFSGLKYDILVAADGSGMYKTVQAAIDSIPENNTRQVVVFIKNGIYKEKLKITKAFVTLVGENRDKTILTYNDYAKMLNADGKEIGTFLTPSVSICTNDFRAENITFQNSSGSGSVVGQALALDASGDRLAFFNCAFLGYQDTIYTGGTGRQYYEECFIKGDVDFIFGSATAVFNQCEIYSNNRNKEPNGYLTAASTPLDRPFGYVFLKCKLTADPDTAADSVYLGRPWKDYAATAFIQCSMGSHIKKCGWMNWNKPEREKTSRYAEYKSEGPGASPAGRVDWSHQLGDAEAEKYTLVNIFSGSDGGWNPLVK
jgi:pectinesterase